VTGVYVAPISFGLGDLVVSLPVIQALVAEGRAGGHETWVVARSVGQARLAERIEGIAGTVSEDEFDPTQCPGRFIDLRDHPLQRDYWWGSPEFEDAVGPLSINEILGRISADFEISADFGRPAPLLSHPRPEASEQVLFVAETDGATKRWATERWATLAERIEALGVEVRLVTPTAADGDMHGAGIEQLRAPSPGDAVDLLGACRAVVGVDTGLTHIAVQQRTPTVTICRQPPTFFRPWPHCRAVVGQRCDDVCASLNRDQAYNARVSLRGFQWRPRVCPVGARCLDPIHPDRVMDALRELEW
jgi:hypothetical protein